MGFWRRLFGGSRRRAEWDDASQGVRVTLDGVDIGEFSLPVSEQYGQPDPAARHIVGGVRKMDFTAGFALLWIQIGGDSAPETMLWQPQTPAEEADALRFYNAARGVGPDAPAARRIKPAKPVRRSRAELERVAAILATPDDKARYYAYADWLEAAGDTYGTFLRLTLALEEPGANGRPDADALWNSRAAVVKKHSESWIKPLTDLGFQPEIMGYRHVDVWMTEHGTIQDFTLDRPGVLPDLAERFFAAAPLVRTLTLTDEDIDPGRVANLPQMAQIEGLFCGAATASQFAAMCRSPHLRKLRRLRVSLSQNEAPTGEAAGLALAAASWLAGLEHLTFTHSRMGAAGTARLAAVAAGGRLRTLDLSNADDTGPGLAALAASPLLANLEELMWAGNAADADALRVLGAATFRDTLRVLKLDQCLSEDGATAGTAALAAGRFTRLEQFELSLVPLGGEAFGPLLTAPWFAGLRALTMSYANLADVDLAALAGVDFRKLESLNLGSNLFGDAGVAALCDGPAWPALTTLILYGRTGDLADVPLPGPAAAAALAASGRFPKLTKLDLRDVPIGQEGAEALARSKRMTGLTSLCVTAAAVGPAGMSALEKRFGEAVEPY